MIRDIHPKLTRLACGALAAAALAGPGEAAELRWIWSGAVTSTSAVVKARLDAPAGEVRLLVARDPSLAGAERLSSAAQALGVLEFRLQGLAPDTAYSYALEVAGRRLGEPGRLHTFAAGAQSFRIGFGSCARTGSKHRIFDVIRELEPLFFLHLGDFHYENIRSRDPARYLRAFDEVLASPRQAALYRSAPIAYVWDDHDYGPNDSDGTLPGRGAALAAYAAAVPHYPLKAGADSIQQAFSVGRVRFLMTDGRSHRDPARRPDGPGKSMLGEAQRAWLFEELERAAASHALVVWVNPVPWITRSQPGSSHGWERYGDERRRIAERIAELGLQRRLLMLSGDGHMVAIDDGSHSNYSGREGPGFPVMHAAPLDRYPRSKGGPYSHGVALRKPWFGLGQIQQFGLLELKDDGERIEIELSGHDGDGELLEGMRLRLSCDAAGCRTAG